MAACAAPLLVGGLLGGSQLDRKVLRRWHLQGDEPEKPVERGLDFRRRSTAGPNCRRLFSPLEQAGPSPFRCLLWPDCQGACNSSPDTDGVLQARKSLIMLGLLAMKTGQSYTDL